MADVFISYSRATREATLDLTEGLMNDGYSVWTDRNLLADQTPFREVIDAAVDGAKAVVAIWSTPALKSSWVQYEANRAFGQKKLINARTPDVAPEQVPPEYFTLNSVPVSDVASIVNTLVAKGIQPEFGGGVSLPDEEKLERDAIRDWRAGVSTTEDVGRLRKFIDDYKRARKVADVAQRRLESLLAIEAARARDANAQAAIKLFAAIQDESDAETFEFFLTKHAAHTDLARVAGRRLIELAPERIAPLTLAAPLAALKDEAAAAIRRRNTKPEDAILRLDPGMHTATIKRIAASRDGRLLATGSDDKTVRLWALPEGRLLRTLRPPIGEGDEGKVFAVAMDPAGRWAAAAGWTTSGDEFITVFETETGRVRQRLGPLPNVVNHLAVSVDGALLAAGLGGANGVRVWGRGAEAAPHHPGAAEGRAEDSHPSSWGSPQARAQDPGFWGRLFGRKSLDPGPAADAAPQDDGGGSSNATPPYAGSAGPANEAQHGAWRLLWEDKAYGDAVYGLAFDAAGRLAATSFDGHIRLYDPAGRLLNKAKAAASPQGGGTRPFGVAFDADGRVLAVGYSDAPRLDLLAADTLDPLPGPDLAGLSGGNLASVAFTQDGRLAAGGRYQSSGCPILAWAQGGRGPRAAMPAADTTIMGLSPLPGGALAFGAGDPAWGVLDAAGRRTLFKGPPGADLRNKVREHFTVSADGHCLRFGLRPFSQTPVHFDVGARTLANAPNPMPGFSQADTASLPITGWENGISPALSGNALALRLNERARALAIAPDRSGFALGAEFSLYRFDAAGAQVWSRPVPGVCWGVNLARAGRLIIAAYGDGTIRWHRWADGAELLALYIHLPEGPDGPRNWILFTPQGFYDCAPGADDIIGWHVNRGPDEAADFYPAGDFASAFKKPERIDAALNV